MSRKRRRLDFRFRIRRPIDKSLIVINKPTVSGALGSTTLTTATTACTVTGIGWSLSSTLDGGTGTGTIYWAIVLLKEGETLGTFSSTDRATFYSPESNVLAYGFGHNRGNTVNRWDSITKTQRKLMNGDKILFITVGENVNTSEIYRVIRFFCKF